MPYSKVERRVFVYLAALVFLALLGPLIFIPLRISLNYNEGWNAYQAQHAFNGSPLYPEGNELTTNNYPPLSFYFVGALGLVLGDNIIAGRVIAFASLLICGILIGKILLYFGVDRFVAVCSALLFLAYNGVFFHGYVGMNDPQWLAHAVMMTGFAQLIRRSGDTRSLSGASFLMVAGGFVKHNLIALPLAVAVWLAWQKRRSFWIWSSLCLVILIIGLGALYWVYGADAFTAMFQKPRGYSLRRAVFRTGTWLMQSTLFLASALLLAVVDLRSQEARLTLLYLTIAVAMGSLASGGLGVNDNVMFDATIAGVMAAGLALDRIARRLAGGGGATAQAIQAAGVAALSIVLLIRVPNLCGRLGLDLLSLPTKFSETNSNLAVLNSHEGPAACETLALCYWAEKPFEMDFFYVSQKLATGLWSIDDLAKAIDDKRYSVIQLERDRSEMSDRLPQIASGLLKSYEIKSSDSENVMLVRISQP